MTDQAFDELKLEIKQHGVEAAFARLTTRLRDEARFHELFDARLMEARYRLGLPVILTTSLDDLPEPVRSRMEEAYLAACREVGGMLLASGYLREAWMYLRPVGEKATVAAALEKIEVDDENYEALLDIALHEGVHPTLGFELLLARQGTCSSITAFDAEMHNRPRAERRAVAALLVRHLHNELMESLRAQITRQSGKEPAEKTAQGLIENRDWLFANDDYHIDTTHLSSVVRFALLVDEPETLRLAVDLTEYGKRLSPQYQSAGEEPFSETYPAHEKFFRAELGEGVDEAMDYFRTRAEAAAADDDGSTGPAEVYIALLSRLGRNREALEAAVKLLPPGARPAGFAPTMMELARLSGDYQCLMEACQERGDLVGFTAGLVENTVAGKK